MKDGICDMRKKWLALIGVALLVGAAILLWRLDIPHWKKLDLSKVMDLPATTMVYDQDGKAIGALRGGEHRVWASLSEVPQDVQNAFIAAEDLRFYRHHGVDLHRLLGALWKDIRTLSYAQGGSTITQQLIKLTHLSQTKTISRKAQEIVLALKLEKAMDKRQILEAYLNAVYFGHGAYGIEAASNVYFNKHVSQLSLSEGALLAGVIKSPSNYAPHLNPDRAVSRRNKILRTMAENGMITDGQCEAATAEPVQLAMTEEDGVRYAWYMDEVLREAGQRLNLSADEVLSGGYAIYTGFDSAMQGAAEALFERQDAFPVSAADGTPVQAALVALNSDTGELAAVVGGRQYDVMRGLNRATQAMRQPGSAFKPVSTYAAAIDAYGYVPTSTVDDTPRTFAGGYAPTNAGGASYGRVTLREALSRSLNVATVALADAMGTSALRNYAQRFGLPLAAEDANLSMALGALTYGVSPSQLGAAYCALANGGERVTAHAIRRIEDGDGRVLYLSEAENARSVSPETAYMITDMLKTAATKGSAKALSACGFPVAGKTGTVSEQSGGTRDIWTVAYTPEIVVSVWMGFDNPDAKHAMPASEGGSGYPARMCADFLKAVSAGLGKRDFVRPTGVRLALLDGYALAEEGEALLCTDKTPRAYAQTELFHPYDIPQRFSGLWAAPAAISDFRLLTGPGETPVLAFTAQSPHAEYVLSRTSNGQTEELAVLGGSAGQELRYADTDQDLTQTAEYTLLPRNHLAFECGELIAGPLSEKVLYAPGGLLNTIMGVGAAEATPAPAEVESEWDQSLFG